MFTFLQLTSKVLSDPLMRGMGGLHEDIVLETYQEIFIQERRDSTAAIGHAEDVRIWRFGEVELGPHPTYLWIAWRESETFLSIHPALFDPEVDFQLQVELGVQKITQRSQSSLASA